MKQQRRYVHMQSCSLSAYAVDRRQAGMDGSRGTRRYISAKRQLSDPMVTIYKFLV